MMPNEKIFAFFFMVWFGALMSIINLLVKFFLYLSTEYKYLICRGKCKKCRNWKCPFFNKELPEGGCNYDNKNKDIHS